MRSFFVVRSFRGALVVAFVVVGGRFWRSPFGVFWRWSRWCRVSAPVVGGGLRASRAACFRAVVFSVGSRRCFVSPFVWSRAPLFVRGVLLAWWGLFWVARFPLFWSVLFLGVFGVVSWLVS